QKGNFHFNHATIAPSFLMSQVTILKQGTLEEIRVLETCSMFKFPKHPSSKRPITFRFPDWLHLSINHQMADHPCHTCHQSVSSSKLDLQTSDVRSLVDPLFQGMSESQRRYFDYSAALFLVNVELLESGKRSWKPHLEGAAQILSMTQPLTLLDESLKDYIMSDCIVYSILSLTFNPSAPNLQNHLESCQILSILDKTTNSYLCCPPELLNILLMASQLLDSSEDGVTASSCAALLEQARSVDLDSWAYKLHDQNTIRSRFLAGLAHQIAACLYVLQVVPALDNSMDRGTTHTLLEGLYNTLSQIPDNDPNFKATAWPSFVLGATTESQETQSWVIDRLKRMAVVFPWGFIYSAVDTLQVLWRLSEKQRVAASWVQTLRQLDVNFLIV
ncbi:uncharacterized protein FOBCDRAFT_148033, partial [Fusarium oxysporum Fo47]|uniref:uncharacterized protein n=1 Tax=Fusarium oxysporum Fo47 TaxID=660027 RepID=UPI0028698E09